MNDNNKKALKMIFNQFLLITTILLLVFGILKFVWHFAGADESGLPYTFPLEVIVCSLSTSLCSFIYYSPKELTKKQFLIRCTIHFLLLFAVVSGEGYLFHWVNELADFLVVGAIFFIIYVSVWIITYLSDKNNSNLINKALHNIKEKEDKE